MSAPAVRTKLSGVDAPTRAALMDAAARDGALHASSELVQCGFGAADAAVLAQGIGDKAAGDTVDAVLRRHQLVGDDGPAGTGVVAMGALPFSRGARGSLSVPSLLCSWQPSEDAVWVTQVPNDGHARLGALEALTGAATIAPPHPLPNLGPFVEQMTGDDYALAVDRCVERLRRMPPSKVVLARSGTVTCDGPVDAAALCRALGANEPTCTLYAYPVGARRFAGATPELVVSTADGLVASHPHAGTVGLRGTPADRDRMAWLAASPKNRVEHALVVRDIVERLSPLCDSVSAGEEPVIVELTSVAHLGTWVEGKLRGARSARTAIDVLAALHPTPAVGGMPRDAALSMIAEYETAERGVWAGPVGWVDAEGNSSWMLGIRGVLVDGDTLEAWAGAGIVADSVGSEERDETDVKLESVLRVFAR